MARPFPLVAATLLFLGGRSQEPDRRAAPNAGIAALILFAESSGIELDASGFEKALSACPGTDPTLGQVRQAGAILGLRLTPAEATLDGLRAIPGPVIAAESDPPGYAVYLLRGPRAVQRLDRDGLRTLTWAGVSARFAGRVLRLPPDGPRPAALAVDEFHAVVDARGPGDVVKRVFHVGNSGPGALTIRVARVSCECVTTLSDESPVPAGGETLLTLSFRAGHAGRATHRVVLATGDPYWPRATLTLELRVPQAVAFYPERLYLTHGRAIETTLSAPETARITGLVTTAPWLEAKVARERRDPERRHWSLDVSTTPETPGGESRAEVFLEIAAPGPTIVRLPVTVRRFDSDGPKSKPPESDGRPPVRILYTTDFAGFLVPCECVPGQLGGVARIATLVDGLRREVAECFLLDGGGALDRYEKTPTFAGVFSALGVAACGLSERDRSAAGEPWRNALTGHKIAVTSLPDVLTLPTKRGPIAVVAVPERTDPSAVADRIRNERAAAVAILSRMGVIADVRLARALGEHPVPVVILGASQSAEIGEAIRVGAVLLAPVGDRGMYVTCVDLGGDARRIPVRSETAERKDVAQIVARYFEEENRILRESLGTAAEMPPSVSSCARCHEEETKLWRASRHAAALKTLASKDRLVRDCLPCHSEGFRRTGVLAREDDGVTCASCHGRGREHAKDPSGERTTPATAASDCTVCHAPRHQITNFHYESALERIRHWKTRRP